MMTARRQRGSQFARAPRTSRSLRLCGLALLFLSFAFNTPLSFSDARVSTETRAGRLAVFDDVWQTITERYYDPSMRGVDWSAERERFRPVAAEAHTSAEFYTTLRRMISSLHDAHTRVFAPEERSEWDHPTFTGVGLSLRELGGRLIVARVERGSEAEGKGVRPGDEVVSVDGEPAAVVVARRAAEGATASTDTSAHLSAVARLFDGARDSSVTIILADERGRDKIVRLTRTRETRVPQFDVRRVGGVAVVHFNIFTPEIATALVRAMREDKTLRGARGVVIDLRDNGGGEAESMIDIASAFLPTGTRLGAFTDRDGRTVDAPRTRRAMLSAADEITSFRGGLVVLTGGRTASAAEIFVAALKEAGRARVLGEQTCGCVLAIRTRHALPDGGLLDVSEMDYRTARDRRLEGAGIAPDETVAPTRRDIEEHRDPALARAVALLRTTK
jgi:carboxyl-terminal processing protease